MTLKLIPSLWEQLPPAPMLLAANGHPHQIFIPALTASISLQHRPGMGSDRQNWSGVKQADYKVPGTERGHIKAPYSSLKVACRCGGLLLGNRTLRGFRELASVCRQASGAALSASFPLQWGRGSSARALGPEA